MAFSFTHSFVRPINEFYDREVTNILNLGRSQGHGTVVMAGDKTELCVLPWSIDTQLIICIQWQRR